MSDSKKIVKRLFGFILDNPVSEVTDSLKRGDKVKATLPNGNVVEGTFLEEVVREGKEPYVRIKLSGNGNSNVWAYSDKVENLSALERSQARSDKMIDYFKSKIDECNEEYADAEYEIQDIYESLANQDPDYKNSSDGSVSKDSEYYPRLKELESRKKYLERRIQGYQNRLKNEYSVEYS